MTKLPIFTMERVFNAPLDLVWKAWTDPVLLARWYGPGVETVIHEFDLKVGGVWRNEMRMKGKDGSPMSDFSLMTFTNINPQTNIDFELASTDGNWTPQPSQMMPDWPRLFDTKFVFEDNGEQTTVTITQVPLNATDAEIACFAGMVDHMGHGWGAGFNVIADILSELQS